MAARSSLLRRPTPGARPAHRTSSVVAAPAALAPRLVHHYPDGLLNLRSLGHPDRTAPAVAAQEDVERARTAVAGAGGGEAEHDARRAPALEPRLEPRLQHRRLVLRVVAAAVHDEHAAMPEDDRLREKAIHRDACGLRRHAVQVEVVLPGEVTAPEPAQDTGVEPHDRALDVLARVGDVETGGAAGQVGECGERLRLLTYRGARGPGWRGPVDPRGALARQRDHALHRVREEVRLLGARRWTRRRGTRRRRLGQGAQLLPQARKGGVQRVQRLPALRALAAGSPTAPH